jgi:hypothetical protein
MASLKDFLQSVVENLQQAGIDYVICGSIAASFYGVERSTQDTDIIINPTEEQLTNFLRFLGDAYYVSSDAALEALKRNTMFNIIDVENAWKADLIIRKKTDFHTEEFHRKRKEKLLGKDLYILSPEDTILSKLEWAKSSSSEQQLRDALCVATIQYESLDCDYLYKWAKELKVESSLEELLKQAKEQLNSG